MLAGFINHLSPQLVRQYLQHQVSVTMLQRSMRTGSQSLYGCFRNPYPINFTVYFMSEHTVTVDLWSLTVHRVIVFSQVSVHISVVPHLTSVMYIIL